MAISAFGRRLRWQRERAGLDTRPLAERLGMARETLNRIENGHQGTRPNAHRVKRAAEFFQVPEHYFTTESVKEIMARVVAELPLPELAQMLTTGRRLAWAIDQLTRLFPPQEFNLDAVRRSLGVSPQDLRLYCEDHAIPVPSFLSGFSEATGIPMTFLTAGRTESYPLSFEAVIEEAQRRGVTPDQLKQALDALFPASRR